MPIEIELSPWIVDANITGRKERFKFVTEEGRSFQFVNGVYIGHDIPEEDIESARQVVVSFKEDLPELVTAMAKRMERKGEPEDPTRPRTIRYSDEEYLVTLEDYNLDGRTDSFVMTSRTDNWRLSINANRTAFCGKEAPRAELMRCEKGERTVFADSRALAERSSDTNFHVTRCIEKQLNPVIFGCYGKGQIEVQKVDTLRRGVREYLKLFDELFEK